MKTFLLGAMLALTAFHAREAQAARIVDVTGLFAVESVLVNCGNGPFCDGTTWYSYTSRTISFDLDLLAIEETAYKSEGNASYNYSITVKKLAEDRLAAIDSSLYHNYKLEGQIGDYVGSGKAFQFSYVGNAVPEPATWAMMMLGFGAVGYAMRKRKAVVHFA